MSDQLEANKKLVMEILDADWHAGDPAAVERYYAPDFRYEDPGAPQITDRDGLAALVAATAAAFPDLRLDVHDLVAEGDVVVKRYTFTGTHTGDFAGIPATGGRVAGTGSELYRIRDGKVVEAVNLYRPCGASRRSGGRHTRNGPRRAAPAGR